MKRPRPGALVITVLASVIAALAITGLTVGLTGSAHATSARPNIPPAQVHWC
jgi:hypothetical protein